MTADGVLPTIAVIVPVRNGAASIHHLLASLVEQDTTVPWELIVVDNGSTDGSGAVAGAFLAAHQGSSLVRTAVVRFDDVIGYASPRNEGVRSASAPLLAFCDADDTVATGWLDAIVAALSLHPLVGSSIEVMGSGEPSSVVVPTTFGIPVVHTCGLGCTRALFDSLGGFDPAFDAGGEDVDFSIRARLVQGVVPALAPGADYRLHLRTSLGARWRQAYRNGRSQVRLVDRHGASLGIPPSSWRLLVHRLTDLVRWSPRLLRADSRPGYVGSVGVVVGRLVACVRHRVRWF